MNKHHPTELELIPADDGSLDAKLEEHLHWCSRCQNVAADYRWLQTEIEGTLATVAQAVPLPRSQWQGVEQVLLAGQRRRAIGWRVSGVVGVLLAVFCLKLFFAPILGTAAVAQSFSREPAIATPPRPMISVAPDGFLHAVASPTPVAVYERKTPPPTLAPVLPPTPPPQVES